MSRRHGTMLGALALIWASSFMFIKVAVRERMMRELPLQSGRFGIKCSKFYVLLTLKRGNGDTKHA